MLYGRTLASLIPRCGNSIRPIFVPVTRIVDCNRIDPMQYLLPRTERPIVVIGAGGIVRDAHLPAYRMAGFRVHGICDIEEARAQTLAAEYGISHIYRDSV